MDRVVYWLAVLANIIQVGFVCYLFTEARGNEVLMALLLFLPPVLSSVALFAGPDREERRLERKVRKARLAHELQKLSG